jgi:hypothetical protein
MCLIKYFVRLKEEKGKECIKVRHPNNFSVGCGVGTMIGSNYSSPRNPVLSEVGFCKEKSVSTPMYDRLASAFSVIYIYCPFSTTPSLRNRFPSFFCHSHSRSLHLVPTLPISQIVTNDTRPSQIAMPGFFSGIVGSIFSGPGDRASEGPGSSGPILPPPGSTPDTASWLRIWNPTLDELRRGLYIWDQIAERSSLKYAFVGMIDPKLRGSACEIHGIEILVEPEALANNEAWLNEIGFRHQEHFGITSQTGHQLIIIDHEGKRGIALEFHAAGTNGYPHLIPPYGTPARTREHSNQQPTYYLPRLYDNSDRRVPVLLAREIVLQRLLKFDPFDESQKDQDIKDIADINRFLHCIVKDGDRFRPEVAHNLLPRVKAWLRFADANFILTGWQEVDLWVAAGVMLTVHDMSYEFRAANVQGQAQIPAAWVPSGQASWVPVSGTQPQVTLGYMGW